MRDLIPDIIEASGRTPVTRELDAAEYESALLDKLFEEADEVRRADRSDRPDELADVFEVLSALAASLDLTMADIAELAADKRLRRGGFGGRVWLE